VGGVIVGVLDLAYAIVVYSPKRPILIPRSIASGVLERAPFVHGASSAALGVMPHGHMSFPLRSAEYAEHWFFVGLPIACRCGGSAAMRLLGLTHL
jgi:hypothetical protein